MSKSLKRIELIEKKGSKYQGKLYLLKYLNGERISPVETIKAKCYDCMGYYADGRVDCKVDTCPNYPFMPFSSMGYEKKKRVMSDEQKVKMAENLKKARAAK